MRIVTPVIVAQGFDPVWFGVLMMLLIETAMITPPVGINLFVVQGVREHGQLHEVAALLIGQRANKNRWFHGREHDTETPFCTRPLLRLH